MKIELTKTQRTALGERIDDVLEDTEDWQMDDDEFAKAIEFWLGILLALGETEKEAKWREDYKHFI